ncbi:MAG: hypothetical protein NC324_07410 [Bacteroides sp.]|nr:hypothetical protein [Bacteroides sp.]
MPELQLVDFNDLFVIAVGLAATYIAFGSPAKTAFLDILSGFTSQTKNRALKRKEKAQREEEEVIAQIKYFLDSKLIKPQTEGALRLVTARADEVMQDICELEDWANRKQAFHTRSEYLRVISFDCFFFGLFALFVGALQYKCLFRIDGLLQVMLLCMGGCLVHCLFFEHVGLKKCKPKIWMHSLFWIAALIIGILLHDRAIFSFSCGIAAILSVAVCFCGFISYFIMNLIVNLILLIVIPRKISLLKIEQKVKEQKDDIERYQPELDNIDSTLSEVDLNKDLSIRGGSKTTAS